MDIQTVINQKVGAAWSQYRAGNRAAAIKAFEQVLTEEPSHVDALYGLGLVLRADGDVNGARTRWQAALDIANRRLEEINEQSQASGPISAIVKEQKSIGLKDLNIARPEDQERFFMSTTMLKQRLSEIK